MAFCATRNPREYEQLRLVEKREQLKEDLQDKTSALHIDLNCVTHEAINGKPKPGLNRQRLPKAMKMDPTFLPGVQMPLTAR